MNDEKAVFLKVRSKQGFFLSGDVCEMEIYRTLILSVFALDISVTKYVLDGYEVSSEMKNKTSWLKKST